HLSRNHGIVSLGISYKDEDGRQRIKSFHVGDPDMKGYQKKYDEVMERAKAFRDKINMKRFGVRWVNYKRRKKAQQEINPNSGRSEEHTSELQSRFELVCRLML